MCLFVINHKQTNKQTNEEKNEKKNEKYSVVLTFTISRYLYILYLGAPFLASKVTPQVGNKMRSLNYIY